MNNIIEECRNQTKKEDTNRGKGRVSVRLGKFRCQNFIGEFDRCWNRASKLALMQEEEKDKTLIRQQQQQKRRIWICDGCFKLRLLNDRNLQINYYKLQFIKE